MENWEQKAEGEASEEKDHSRGFEPVSPFGY